MAAQAIDWQNDPDFAALPLPEKHKALLSIDPEYKGLPPQEQQKALDTIHYGAKEKPEEGPGLLATARDYWKAKPEEGVLARAGKGVMRTAEGAAEMPGALAAPPVTPTEHVLSAIPQVGKGLLAGKRALIDPQMEQFRKAGEDFTAGHYSEAAGHGAAGALPVWGPIAAHLGEVAGTGDIAGAMGEAAPFAAAEVAPAVSRMHPALETGAFAPALARRGAAGTAELARRGVEGGRNLIEGGEPAETGPESIRGALATSPGKKGVKSASMDKAIQDTQADLAALERQRPTEGKGAEVFRDVAERIDERKDAIWQAHTDMVGRHPEMEIDPAKIRQAGESVLSKTARAANQPEAAAVEKFLDGLDDVKSGKDADNMIREINADLRGKEVLGYGPLQIRARLAVVKAYRAQLEQALIREGETGVREINRRWGALDEIGGRVKERAVQLANKEAGKGPIPDWLHIYAALHPGAGSMLPMVGFGARLAGLLKPEPGTMLRRGMNQLGRSDIAAAEIPEHTPFIEGAPLRPGFRNPPPTSMPPDAWMAAMAGAEPGEPVPLGIRGLGRAPGPRPRVAGLLPQEAGFVGESQAPGGPRDVPPPLITPPPEAAPPVPEPQPSTRGKMAYGGKNYSFRGPNGEMAPKGKIWLQDKITRRWNLAPRAEFREAAPETE